jgi:hypothetical protein
MVLEIFTILKTNVCLAVALGFFIIIALHFAALKLLLYRYKRKYHKTPIVFSGMFRFYSKTLISNVPSRREQQFYMATNKFTLVFNSLLVATVCLFLLICFR